jgi:hypothetical protein
MYNILIQSNEYKIHKDDFYNSILFSIKNDYSTTSTQSLPNIIVGEFRIPINIIINNLGDNYFDGMIDLKLRNNIYIGQLKIKLILSHKSIFKNDVKFIYLE